MRRLQTIIVALSLVVAMACNTSKAENVLPDNTPVESIASEDIVVPQGDDTTSVSEPDKAIDVVEESEAERTIPIGHLLWLLVPAVAIATLGYLCKKKITEEMTEKETLVVKWLVGSLLVLYVVELLLFVILKQLGVFGFYAPKYILLVATFAISFMLLNAYGAFVANSAILRKYKISFPWKRVIIYVGIALAVETIFALVVPLAFDVSIFDSRMLIPNVIALCTLLFVLFGVDMYQQNAQSLKVIPVVFVLFTIGSLMSGTLVLIAFFAVGVWYIARGCLVKDKMKDRRNASLECESCSAKESCSAPGTPCEKHQDWKS